MNFKCFNFDDGFPSEFIENPIRLELLKKNLGFPSKKLESEKFRTWTSLNKVSDLMDLEIKGTKVLDDYNKLWKSMTKDQRIGKSLLSTRHRPSGERNPLINAENDHLLSDFNIDTERMKNRISKKCFDVESEYDVRNLKNLMFRKKLIGKTFGCGSDDNYEFVDTAGTEVSKDGTWRRNSSCQGNSTFPCKYNTSMNSDTSSDKFFGRSISTYSEDSVCTEKSADCSTISETLPNGGSRIQSENSETWLRKSTSGTTISEKRVQDSTMKEKSEDKLCDISTKKTFHVERSATGSSIQEKSLSETTTSHSNSGMKSMEHTMSSQSSIRKTFRPSNKAFTAQDKSTQHSLPVYAKEADEEWRHESGYIAREEKEGQSISKLANEAADEEKVFEMGFGTEAVVSEMGCDYAKLLGNEKRHSGIGRFRGACAENEKISLDQNSTWSKLSDLEAENEDLQQENSKLQSIVQDVTAVNKRWQKYNNERRVYVQKLLSTIQDLQEQINLISEKSAFSSSIQEKSSFTYEDIEKLKRDYEEHVAELELQIKSHKDDCDAERKEKEKAVKEKESLELKVQELMREIKFLNNVLREKKRKTTFCPSCRREEIPKNEMYSAAPFLTVSQNSFQTPVHIPHHACKTSPKECFYKENHKFHTGSTNEQLKLCFKMDKPNNILIEPFTESFNFSRGPSTGDTIVVENEKGLRLAITEQYPFKESLQLKSILKKQDKKARNFSKLVSEQTNAFDDSICPSRNCVTYEDLEESSGLKKELTLGENGSPKHVPSLSVAVELLNSRSKSEPNTRNNSSENLKPLRESSSWNSQCVCADPNCTNAICLKCESSSFPSVGPHFSNDF